MLETTRLIAALLFCACAPLASAQTAGALWRPDRSAGEPVKPQYNVDGTRRGIAGVKLADGFAGVDPTGVADSTSGVQAALNSAAPGSVVYFGGKYYVGNFTIPEHVTVECSNSYPDPLITAGVGTLQNPYDWKGQFKQKIGTTITGGQGGVIRGCLLIREGLSLPVTTAAQATTLLTQMSGTGVTLNSVSFEFDHVAMIGHQTPINSSNPGGHALSNRVKILYSIFDNLNGPIVGAQGDPATIENNQIFPFLTIAIPDIGPQGTTPAIFERTGPGLHLIGPDNASQINGNLIFGHPACMQGEYVVENHFFRNHCEFPPSKTTNTTGFYITGAYNKLVGNLSIGYARPYLIENGGYPNGNTHTVVEGNTAICPAVSNYAFRFVSGSFDLTNNHIQNCPNGISVEAGVIRGHIGYNEFFNVTTKLKNASTGPIIVDGFSTTPTVTAATYTVLASDKSITANGSATLTLTLPKAANYHGRRLMVTTIAAFTVVSASSNVVPLAGGAAGTAILPAIAGKWAELESDGTNWKIIAEGASFGSAALANTGTSGQAIPFLDGANTWSAAQTYSVSPIFSTLSGYLKGNGASALTAAATIPSVDLADGNTGTGSVVHATSPTITTPTLRAPKLAGYTVAGLPKCNAGATGTLAYVTDATDSAHSASLAGGGSAKVLVFCDGAVWTPH